MQSPEDTKDEISMKAISDLELLTIKKASETISVLEETIAVWNDSKIKSEKLKSRMKRIIKFHTLISGWARRMLKAQNLAKQDRILLLSEFSDICIMGVNS